jgi:hypothetical protein
LWLREQRQKLTGLILEGNDALTTLNKLRRALLDIRKEEVNEEKVPEFTGMSLD